MSIAIRIFFIAFLIVPMIFPNTVYSKNANAEEPIEVTGEGSHFLELDTVMIPVFNVNGKTGFIALNVTAEVSTDDELDMLRENMPKVRDAFIRVIYRGVKEKAIIDSQGNLDIVTVKDYLLGASNYVMKDKIVKDILLRDITQQTF